MEQNSFTNNELTEERITLCPARTSLSSETKVMSHKFYSFITLLLRTNYNVHFIILYWLLLSSKKQLFKSEEVLYTYKTITVLNYYIEAFRLLLLLLLLLRHTRTKKTNPLFHPQGASGFWWAKKQKLPEIAQILILLLTKKFQTQKRSQKWPLKVKKTPFLTPPY